MNKVSKNLLIIIAMLLFLSQLLGGLYIGPGVNLKKVGTTTMNYLQVGVVPEAVAMGDAYNALSTGVVGLFYNPASVSELNTKGEVFAGITNWIADIKYHAFGIVYNVSDNLGTIGLSFVSVDYGEIKGAKLIPSDLMGIDKLGYRETGRVDNVGAYAIGLTYSKKITNFFMIGGTVKLAHQSLGENEFIYDTDTTYKENNMDKLAIDLGVKYYTPIKSFRFGMSIKNFATNVKYEAITTHLPLTFALSGAANLFDFVLTGLNKDFDLNVAIEMAHPNNYTPRMHFGAELNYNNFLFFRTGYMTNHDILGPAFGVGLKKSLKMGVLKVDFSYSLISEKAFNEVSRFSFMYVF